MSFLYGMRKTHFHKHHISDYLPSPGQLLNRLFRIEKTSLSRGSMTVEAAIVLPCFLFFFINLSASLQMIALHGNLEYALHSAGNEVCLYGSLLTDPMRNLGGTGHVSEAESGEASAEDTAGEEDGELQSLMSYIQGGVLSGTYVKYRMVSELGEDYLSSSPLRNGASSLTFIGSTIGEENDIVDIKLSYAVKTPLETIGISGFYMAGRFYGHLWNGYEIVGSDGEISQEQMVYITEDSEVYHLTTSCTHLRLSVRFVEYANLDDCRNNNGGRYYPCSICVAGEHPDVVCITTDGDKYHYSDECYTLTRSYTAVPLSEVADSHRPCSRCGR